MHHMIMWEIALWLKWCKDYSDQSRFHRILSKVNCHIFMDCGVESVEESVS